MTDEERLDLAEPEKIIGGVKFTEVGELDIEDERLVVDHSDDCDSFDVGLYRVQLIGIWLIRVYNSFLQWRTEPNANNHLRFGCNFQILECHSSCSIAKISSWATRVEVVG
ncbi:unnamed protein product [Prunus brigantina]